jgi:glycosyltransferase involved in cell wall biosynthesis
MASNSIEIQEFSGRLGLQQRVLPSYRGAFFDMLSQACAGGLSVFAGKPQPDEQIKTTDHLDAAAFVPVQNWHIFRMGSPFYQCWQFGLLDWLESWQPDALIVEANPRYRSTPRAAHWMHERRKPVLGWGLGAPDLSGFLGNVRRRARYNFLSSLDGLIAYSQRGADQYHALGIPLERIFVAPNAVAPKPETSPPKRSPTFTERPKLLFVGRLQARKRIDLLLQACAGLPESLQPQVWIIGDGPARLEFQETADHIYPRAEFLGARYGSDLDFYFDSADLFVLPGTGGLAVQQAMAHALPVIVAQGDGTQDDLVRSENGWRIQPDDLAALTETIRTALEDPQKLRSMGDVSYRIVSEEVNIQAMVSVFVQALTSVTCQGK